MRVVDEETETAMPARLALRASDGSYPGDRLGVQADRWPNVDAHAVFIDGEATFTMPSGKASVIAARGLEYRAASRSVDVPAGGEVAIEMRLKRIVNMRTAGWVSGDLHVHMIHGENQRPTSYDDVALTCRANGLDFVAVNQEYVGAGTLDLVGYQAKCRAASTDDFQMFLGGERPKNILGHQVLLGAENPFTISEETPYFLGAHAVRAQRAVSVYVHPIRYFPSKHYGGQWLDFPGNNLARELVYDAYLGPSFDGLSVLSDEPAHRDAHQLWFNLLNRGFFVPVFADSDACFDRPTLGLKAPGLWNTYFYLGKDVPVTQEALGDAVRHGRTMATTGPLVDFRIDGELSGTTLLPDGKQCEITIDAYYPQDSYSLQRLDEKSGQPIAISKIELLRNGVVVHQWQPQEDEVHLQHPVSESDRCWYAVRVFGTNERWQIGVSSPIYFSDDPVATKQEPRETLVRGRIYDFSTGKERSGSVSIHQQGKLLRQLDATGPFEVRMPLDAEITVSADGERSITKNLLMDYGPIHRFLWYLESSDLGKEETFDRFEFLTREVELEFPIGYRMAGCFVADELQEPTDFPSLRVLESPESVTDGTVAVAAVLTDVECIAPGDAMHVAAIFRDEGSAAWCGPYVVEARGYDPMRPTGFGALKLFGGFEKTWDTADDLGRGYKLLRGEISVPAWVEAGPVKWIDLSVRVRRSDGDAASVGLAIPLGKTRRALTLSNSWPTMPLSWPDRNYGIGPLKICNRVGRQAQPRGDYRQLQLSLELGGERRDWLPSREGEGCPDSRDAMYTEHYLDQILNDESKLFKP